MLVHLGNIPYSESVWPNRADADPITVFVLEREAERTITTRLHELQEIMITIGSEVYAILGVVTFYLK